MTQIIVATALGIVLLVGLLALGRFVAMLAVAGCCLGIVFFLGFALLRLAFQTVDRYRYR